MISIVRPFYLKNVRLCTRSRGPGRIRGDARATRERNGLIRAIRQKRPVFARGCDNRYAADSTMVIVNQGILKIWQDICWLRSRSRISCHTRLAAPAIKYSIMLFNNPNDFRRGNGNCRDTLPCGTSFSASCHSPSRVSRPRIIIRSFASLRVGRKLLINIVTRFYKFVTKFFNNRTSYFTT